MLCFRCGQSAFLGFGSFAALEFVRIVPLQRDVRRVLVAAANYRPARAFGRLWRTALCAALALAWLAASAPAVRAATMSYTFSISSDYSLLMNPQSTQMQGQVAQKSSAVVSTANNNPVIMITN